VAVGGLWCLAGPITDNWVAPSADLRECL